MTAEALNVKLNLKTIDLDKDEHLSEEFLKLNPQHTVPTLVDDGFAIWESRAICVYLVNKYGQYDDPLFPKDPKTRAVINQRLYFDMGSLFKHFSDFFFASFYGKEQNPEDLKKLNDSVEIFSKFLEASEYAAGTQQLSLADLVLFASVSTFEAVNYDFTPYPRVQKWIEMMKSAAPGSKLNQEGVDEIKAWMSQVEKPVEKAEELANEGEKPVEKVEEPVDKGEEVA